MTQPKFIDAGSSGQWGWHATEVALRCPRMFAYTYRVPGAGHRDTDSAPLLKGSLVHQGLAHHYIRMGLEQLGMDPEEFATPHDAIGECAQKLGPHAPQYVDLARHVVQRYAMHWASEKLEVLNVEEVFSSEIGGYTFTQRFDLVVREQDGKIYIYDHKCLPASSEVFTNAGPTTIGELFAKNEGWIAAARGTDNRLVWAPAMAPVDAGVQDVWQITTAAGQTGRFGYRHPILTDRGWVQACDLRPGDRVAAAIGLPDLPEAPFSDDMLWLVGSLICDGGMKVSGPMYTKESAAKRDRFSAALVGEGMVRGIDFTEVHPEDRIPFIRLAAASPVARKLKDLGLIGVGSAEKRVTRKLMALSKRQVGVLIAALWSGDGHAGVRKNKTPRLVYASRSRELCLDIKALLARLGIASTVTDSSVAYKGSRRGYYFTTIIGTASKVKFVEAVLSGEIPAIGIDADAILAACHRPGAREKRKFQVDGDIMWDIVESCLMIGRERCYDIEVPENHTFVAEGLVTHNTTGRITRDVASRYTLSGQFIGMHNFGARVFGDEFGGVKLNLIEVGDGAFGGFKRQTPDPAPGAIKNFPLTVLHARERIDALDKSGLDPAEWPQVLSEQTCVSAYGPCQYFEKCRWG